MNKGSELHLVELTTKAAIAETTCPLCESKSRLIRKDIAGYQEPATFSIYGCANCDTHYATPLALSQGTYEAIYNNAALLTGYFRYSNYAQRVLNTDAPLDLLAETEDVYWFVSDYLKKRNASKTAKILEIGSGLGYLTYAISRQGYDIRGMDISERAVEDANRIFGERYFCADLFEYSDTTADRYDTVILTEVIEHVPDPIAFVLAMKRLLKPGGAMVLTTPNKSRFRLQCEWGSDGPPVHFWWFSESSMRQIAIKSKTLIEVWDFSQFSELKVLGLHSHPVGHAVFAARLDRNGHPLRPMIINHAKLKIGKFMRRFVSEHAIPKIKNLLERTVGRKKFLRDRGHLLLSRSDVIGVVLKAE
jgi:2-polyprenyl-3-methyl-5-hydroxy-6-metoxy-1,4-benzoquinol methylase